MLVLPWSYQDDCSAEGEDDDTPLSAFEYGILSNYFISKAIKFDLN